MKKKPMIIAGNWKMNPESTQEATKLFAVYTRLAKANPKQDFVVAAPAVYLETLAKKNKHPNLQVCAQNVFYEDAGSYTGAVSIPMVQSMGVNSVLIGHSERRQLFGVSDEIVNKKIIHAIEKDMPMIVCFGEDERDEEAAFTEVLESQLKNILEPFVGTRKAGLLTLAYEPVWAIGSGAKRAVTEDELFSTLILITNIVKKYLGESRAKKMNILYGGSVNADNAQALSTVPGVAGFLIGRASLNAQSIKAITTNSA